jgi:hypothetical protein
MSARRRQPATPKQVEALRRQYLADLEVLRASAERVHRALDTAAGALSVVREHVRGHGNVSDFLYEIDPMPLRGELSGSLDALERARHTMQRHLFLLLIAEGRSMSDIARTWGISRQLVSRMVNEPE